MFSRSAPQPVPRFTRNCWPSTDISLMTIRWCRPTCSLPRVMSLSQTEVSFYYLKSNHSFLTTAPLPDFADGAKKHIGDLKKRVAELEGMPSSLAEMHLG